MESIATIQPPRTIREVWDSLPEGTLAQIIENQLVMAPAPLDRHQEIFIEIIVPLANYIKKHSLGKVRSGPYGVYLEEGNVFEPDIVFISNENLHKIKKNGLHGAPDLVIEILSPSTARYDQNQKKKVYERHGVREYWIVDPETKEVQGFFLKDDSYGSPLKLEGRIASKVLDYEFEF